VVKCSEMLQCSGGLLVLFFYRCVYGCMFCVLLFSSVSYVLLLFVCSVLYILFSSVSYVLLLFVCSVLYILFSSCQMAFSEYPG
jgi:hypothetical protein